MMLVRALSYWLMAVSLSASMSEAAKNFNRIATYNVCLQIDPTCNTDTETVAEIASVTPDGNTVVYTDAARGVLGFVDITDATMPSGLGVFDVGGEPTSVGVKDDYALVAVNTSPSFTAPSGILHVIAISDQTLVRTMDLAGQPDSVAISPDGNFFAIAIENERDEDLGDGRPPQLPPGFLQYLETADADPMMWNISTVELTGLTNSLFPEDPEPEYVDISSDNICAVTLQENNGLVLVDLTTGAIVGDYSAGTVDLAHVDTVEDDVITADGTLTAVPREPDAIAWIGTEYFATANEGDLDGGSRGFSIFNKDGTVEFDSGNSMDLLTMKYGHYPEGRSENKGSEPEEIHYADFGGTPMLFVTSERGSVIFVYDVTDVTNPIFKQILPSSVGPEGLRAIPSRNLLVAACEVDNRGDKIRGGIVLYSLEDAPANYPTLVSADRADGTPIPFSALSGLAAVNTETLVTVEDSFYAKSRMMVIDVSVSPYTITQEYRIVDSDGVFATALAGTNLTSTLINDDSTINADLEGIATAANGGFWIVHEGVGTQGDAARPFEVPNVLFKVSATGVIEQVVLPPDEFTAIQVRFGFEGVAEDGDYVVIAVQRAWGGESNPRLAIYNQATGDWMYVFYPLDTPASQNGGWVGLSDVAPLGNGKFLVLERDNQGGPDAAIKKIYEIELDFANMSPDSIETITKTEFRDLLADLAAPKGNIYEKVEGLTVTSSGNVFINNDNDGVDDNSGEQQLIDLGEIADIDNSTEAPAPTMAPTSGGAMIADSFLFIALMLSSLVALIV